MLSPVLSVKDVRVIGTDGAQAQQVLATASVPIGVPLARFDATAAQAAVLALPWVASAEVRRGWPNEVVIAVVARTPIALLSGTSKVVDAEGSAFDPSGPPPAGLPTVTGAGVGLQSATAVLASLPADLATRVTSLSASTRDDVELTLRGGSLVRWGSTEQSAFKAEVLRALMRRKQALYDVTAPELPTTFRSG
jgi:cell division protein FtsQ